jgi:hypothetical protein
MYAGINIAERVEVTLTGDKSEPRTVFTIRPLTGPEYLDMGRYTEVTVGADGKRQAMLMITGDYAKTLLTRSIVEIKNGRPDTSIAQTVDSLLPADLIELIKKVDDLNRLSDTDIKN